MIAQEDFNMITMYESTDAEKRAELLKHKDHSVQVCYLFILLLFIPFLSLVLGGKNLAQFNEQC
jgi:hypothetical protein